MEGVFGVHIHEGKNAVFSHTHADVNFYFVESSCKTIFPYCVLATIEYINLKTSC